MPGMGIFSRFFGSAGREAQQAHDRARDRSFALGEAARQRAEQQERERCENIRRELDWRRDLDEQELTEELGKIEIPPRALTEEEAWAEGGDWKPVQSSNVASIQFHADDDRLIIEYKDGSIYAYHPVPMPMAIDLYRASSKGKWVWDNLRVRGTVFGYQIPYEHLSGPSQRTIGRELRKWMRSEETRRKHGNIPPSGRDASGQTIKPRHIR